jgi:hypothetical protein
MANTQVTPIRFAGVDFWGRVVFTTPDNRRIYKSVELMPSWSNDFNTLSAQEKECLLRSLHTTDGFEGEPDCPVPREKFELEVQHDDSGESDSPVP